MTLPSSHCGISQSLAFTQLASLVSGLFSRVDEMLCTKGKLYSVNIYSENWFAALPPWSTWPRMKAWYERLLAGQERQPSAQCFNFYEAA